MASRLLSAALISMTACAGDQHFRLRDPMLVDSDLRPVTMPCRTVKDKDKDKDKEVCTPEEYYSPLAWDGADNLFFRIFSNFWFFEAESESVNANDFDEVPNSAWFTNRIGEKKMSLEDLAQGACPESPDLDTDVPDGSWVIDQGKSNGSTPGFRVRIDGKKYLLKTDAPEQPDRATAASAIGAAMYHAVGFYTSCERVTYIKPSLLKLAEGLMQTDNTGATTAFDQAALEKVLAFATKKDGMVRLQVSHWLPGRLIGPFRYESTRDDDPNDVIDHEDRRELRGARLLAAWINHFDAREQNSIDSWIAIDSKNADSSPGIVRHYYLDMSDSFGAEWAWDKISKRIGHSYYFDMAHVAEDYITFGAIERPWDRAARLPGLELFGYFHWHDFDPETWHVGYSNYAFSKMTERDGAWMARILARFGPDELRALISAGKFSDPKAADWLWGTLHERLRLILDRYLTRLSPVTDVTVEGTNLCGLDLGHLRGVRPAAEFVPSARILGPDWKVVGEGQARYDGDQLCVTLAYDPALSGPDDALARYRVVRISNGVAPGPLEVHLYDLGPAKGFRIAGLARPPE